MQGRGFGILIYFKRVLWGHKMKRFSDFFRKGPSDSGPLVRKKQIIIIVMGLTAVCGSVFFLQAGVKKVTRVEKKVQKAKKTVIGDFVDDRDIWAARLEGQVLKMAEVAQNFKTQNELQEKRLKTLEDALMAQERGKSKRVSENYDLRYYANLTDQYPPARLRDMVKEKQLLHLLCFVYHRYQEFMDNMIITFIYHVRGLLEAGKSSANIAFLQHGAQFSVELPKLVRFLKWFPNQGADSDLSIEEFSQEAYKILPKQKFVPIAKFIEGHSFDKKAAKWKFYKQSSRLLSLYLRPILLSVNFEFYKNDSSVMALIQMLKKHYEANKPPSALKFTDDLGLSLPKSIITYLKRVSEKYFYPGSSL